MEGLDRTIVTEGYPTEVGLHLLWTDAYGWPAIHILQVRVTNGRTVWWKPGFGGTDRPAEIPGMFRFVYDRLLGSSRITPEALAHFEALQHRTSLEVQKMLAAKDKET